MTPRHQIIGGWGESSPTRPVQGWGPAEQVLRRPRSLTQVILTRWPLALAENIEAAAGEVLGGLGGQAVLGVGLGLLLVVVDFPRYPHVHGVPLTSLLKI